MKFLLLKIVTILLLLMNGIGAIYGGWNLIAHPDGSSLGITTEWLQHSPFDNFLVPGIILFIVNGVFSFVALIFLFFNLENYQLLVGIQGFLLGGWIFVQVLMLQEIVGLHVVMAATGTALIICAFLFPATRKRRASVTHLP